MRLKKNIAVSETGFVFDPNSGDSYSLNDIGLEIVELLKQGRSDSSVLTALNSRYDIDRASLEKYYHDFVSMLRYYRLTEERPDAGADSGHNPGIQPQ